MTWKKDFEELHLIRYILPLEDVIFIFRSQHEGKGLTKKIVWLKSLTSLQFDVETFYTLKWPYLFSLNLKKNF